MFNGNMYVRIIFYSFLFFKVLYTGGFQERCPRVRCTVCRKLSQNVKTQKSVFLTELKLCMKDAQACCVIYVMVGKDVTQVFTAHFLCVLT